MHRKQPTEAEQAELFIKELADQIQTQAFGIDKHEHPTKRIRYVREKQGEQVQAKPRKTILIL